SPTVSRVYATPSMSPPANALAHPKTRRAGCVPRACGSAPKRATAAAEVETARTVTALSGGTAEAVQAGTHGPGAGFSGAGSAVSVRGIPPSDSGGQP